MEQSQPSLGVQLAGHMQTSQLVSKLEHGIMEPKAAVAAVVQAADLAEKLQPVLDIEAGPGRRHLELFFASYLVAELARERVLAV